MKAIWHFPAPVMSGLQSDQVDFSSNRQIPCPSCTSMHASMEKMADIALKLHDFALNSAYQSRPLHRDVDSGMAKPKAKPKAKLAKPKVESDLRRRMKEKLDIPDSSPRFCYRCGAGQTHLVEYHPQSRCKIPHSTKVHACPPHGRKLLHEAKDCPTAIAPQDPLLWSDQSFGVADATDATDEEQ